MGILLLGIAALLLGDLKAAGKLPNSSSGESNSLPYLLSRIWDKKTVEVIQGLNSQIKVPAAKFILSAQDRGIYLRAYSGFRSFDEQRALYAKGRTAPGNIVTNAAPGYSFHNYGLALDVVEIKSGKALWVSNRWDIIGKLGKAQGFRWGGDWTSIKDRPHFENGLGKTVRQWRESYLST